MIHETFDEPKDCAVLNSHDNHGAEAKKKKQIYRSHLKDSSLGMREGQPVPDLQTVELT